MNRGIKLALGLALFALVAATAAFANVSRSHASDTLVFGASSDPVVLDGALINDGESIRVVKQMVETLVAQAPGTTNLIPDLATKWKDSADGKTWTFSLRQGVTFHDGTPFNAQAVCFNFNRWYNFKGALQSAECIVLLQPRVRRLQDRYHRKERALPELQAGRARTRRSSS